MEPRDISPRSQSIARKLSRKCSVSSGKDKKEKKHDKEDTELSLLDTTTTDDGETGSSSDGESPSSSLIAAGKKLFKHTKTAPSSPLTSPLTSPRRPPMAPHETPFDPTPFSLVESARVRSNNGSFSALKAKDKRDDKLDRVLEQNVKLAHQVDCVLALLRQDHVRVKDIWTELESLQKQQQQEAEQDDACLSCTLL